MVGMADSYDKPLADRRPSRLLDVTALSRRRLRWSTSLGLVRAVLRMLPLAILGTRALPLMDP